VAGAGPLLRVWTGCPEIPDQQRAGGDVPLSAKWAGRPTGLKDSHATVCETFISQSMPEGGPAALWPARHE